MPNQVPTKPCKRCGEVAAVSKRGYCRLCGYTLMVDSVRQLKAKKGPVYEKWKAGLLASLSHAESRYRVGIEQSLREMKDATLKPKSVYELALEQAQKEITSD